MKCTLSKQDIFELTDIQIVKVSPIPFLSTQEQNKFLNHTTGPREFNIYCEVLIQKVHDVLESYYCYCNCNHALLCLNELSKKEISNTSDNY